MHGIVLGLTIVLGLAVLCEGLQRGDEGTYEGTVNVPKTKYSAFNTKKCPRSYKECSKEEKEAFKRTHRFNPNTSKCCAKTSFEKQTKIQCLGGWVYMPGEDICKAQCNPGCVNGTCIRPNVCQCDPPLILLENKCVQPVCDPPCVNSKCIANETCDCQPGYDRFNSTHCATHCETGFQNDPTTLECIPKCDDTCVNGSCIAPNQCACLAGHEPTGDNYSCRPKCSSCEHGSCIAPDECSCHEGYTNASGICAPVCTEPCVNGFCSSPDMCACNNGYLKNLTDLSVCYKPCKGPCENGICSEHGACICNIGFQFENDTCSPVKPIECVACRGNCSLDDCFCEDGRPCFFEGVQLEVATTGLAGIEVSLLTGAGVIALLFILALVVIHRIWRKRRDYGVKTADECNTLGSVVYTRSDTLIQRNRPDGEFDAYYNEQETAPDVAPDVALDADLDADLDANLDTRAYERTNLRLLTSESID